MAINGNKITFKLSDYGFDKLVPTDLIQSSSAKYIAPEVLKDIDDEISTKTDIYSLGVIAEEMFDLNR